jgi:hypothetical protein
MHIQELWRYPVKSMRGERIFNAVLDRSGIEGDRNIVVVSAATDRTITARTHPRLLGLQASVTSDGITLIEGHPWMLEPVPSASMYSLCLWRRMEPSGNWTWIFEGCARMSSSAVYQGRPKGIGRAQALRPER